MNFIMSIRTISQISKIGSRTSVGVTSHLHRQSSRIKAVQNTEFPPSAKKLKGAIIPHKKSSSSNQLFELTAIDCPITVSFTNMNVFARYKHTHILKNLFGTVRPYNITAVLSSSKSGVTQINNFSISML